MLALASIGVAHAQSPSGPPYDFLRTQIGFDDAQLNAVAAGTAVTKVLETPERREVAIAGVVHLRASTRFFLRMFRDIENFDTAALASRKASDPMQLSDFSTMHIPEEELKSLSKCSIGDCNMKLGRETVGRVASEVDWDAPGAADEAERILREQAFHFASAYLEDGNVALGGYDDKKTTGVIEGDFGTLFDNAPYVLAYAPELHRYLHDYPTASLPGSTDFLYWAQYDYGKPVTRVNHVTIYPTEEGDNGSALVAVKHLWYTHYFTTGLDLHALVRDEKSEEDAFYLVTLVRMRTDGVGGMFGGLVKNSASKAVIKNVQLYLASMKTAIEGYYRDEQSRRP